MVERKREIYIKLDNIEEIKTLFEEVKALQEETKELFKHYDSISYKENEILENWSNYLDDITQKLDHMAL